MIRQTQQLFLMISFFIAACSNNQNKSAEQSGNIGSEASADSARRHDSLLASLNYQNSDEQKKNATVTDNDGDWSMENIMLTNTPEAECMIRTGDIDNLGFGWEQGFTPFSGRSTGSHGFPWDAKPGDAAGTDRIMVPSSYTNGSSKNGSDGYSGTKRPDNDPRPISVFLQQIKTMNIRSASLQLFVDDFQSPVFNSKFQVKINGQRFIGMEKILNALEQTGPIGKIINIKLPDEFLALLANDSLSIFIDDPSTGAGDGFAIDFVKLLINPKAALFTGNVSGVIIDKTTRQPIRNALAEIKNYGSDSTDNEGKFNLKSIPAGVNIINGSAPGYASGQAQVDVIANEDSREITIELSPSEKIVFNNKTMQEGDVLVMKNIQFKLGSDVLTAAGKKELDKLAGFLSQHERVEILLSGHTSTDGTAAFNKTLSLGRVKTCKSYLVSKNIDEGRIETAGFGADKPLVPNDTERNRAKNRRVEMKVTK